ncbi:hypothetical protein JTB14_023855 [Gonioctena quinquepunctata]|nr:hypothetical protein JTB14_023855 [Gonioctena quinquepunctata]
MLKTTDLLLEVRANFVQDTNIHLFANTKSSSSINGSKAVYIHVRRAGARNAAALTSTKLRKHLATMSQVINLSEHDLEQFMGHTSDIHKSCYRLPNDVYQMAKVSKLLILNERGEASKYKGKTLDEIEIDLNVVEENSDEDDNGEEIDDRNQQESKVVMENKEKAATVPKKSRRILERWTEEQKKITLIFFEDHLKKKNPPKKHECLQLQEENPGVFNNKSWEKIKIFVVNNYAGK